MPRAAPNAPRRHRMDRVAYLTEFLPEIRIGMKQDFPWLTENRRRLVGGLDRSERDVPRSGEVRCEAGLNQTALGGGHGVGVFGQM